jgi:hypothetical protein
MPFGPEYQGSWPNIEVALQKFILVKVSSMQVRHDMLSEESKSGETAKGN